MPGEKGVGLENWWTPGLSAGDYETGCFVAEGPILCITHRWSGMDSNFRFLARLATVPSLQALSISLKLFGFRRRTCRPQGPKFRIHFPPPASLVRTCLPRLRF